MLATHRDDGVRDAAGAVRYATMASEATGGREPAVLDTLAAAYAESGRFEDAVATVEKGLEIARGRGAAGAGLVRLLEIPKTVLPI